MDPINEVVLQEEQKADQPKLLMPDVFKILFDQLNVAHPKGFLVGRANFGGHVAIHINYRVVTDRVDREKGSARAERILNLPEKRGTVRDVMDGVGDVNEIVVIFGDRKIFGG